MKSDLHVPPQLLKQEEYRGQQVLHRQIIVYLGDNNVNNQHEGHFSMYLSSFHTQLCTVSRSQLRIWVLDPSGRWRMSCWAVSSEVGSSQQKHSPKAPRVIGDDHVWDEPFHEIWEDGAILFYYSFQPDQNDSFFSAICKHLIKSERSSILNSSQSNTQIVR